MPTELPDRSVDVESSEEDYVKKQFALLLYRLRRLDSLRGRTQGALVQTLLDELLTVDTPKGAVSFVTMGKTAAGRMATILTKQPGTIAWIDNFVPNSVFWDVGANVGVFTLYAGLRRDTRIVAIEPAAVNYFTLAANCEANGLGDVADCLLVGLGRTRQLGRLDVSQFSGAQSFKFTDGERHPGRQAALVLPLDTLIEDFDLPCPNYIKIDVPAMTEAIIEGGARTWQRPEVRSIHVEASDESSTGRRILASLAQYGFTVVSRSEHGSRDLTLERR